MEYPSITCGLSKICKFLYIVKISLSISVIRRRREDTFQTILSSYFSYNYIKISSDGCGSPFTGSEHLLIVPEKFITQAKYVYLLRLIEQLDNLFNDYINTPDVCSYPNRALTLSNDKNALLEMIISTIHDVDIHMLSHCEIYVFGKYIQILFEKINGLTFMQKLVYLDKLACIMFLFDPLEFKHTLIICDIYLQLAGVNILSAFFFYHYSVSFLTNILTKLFYHTEKNMILYCLFTLSDLFLLCENCGLLFDKEKILIIDLLSCIQIDHKSLPYCNIPSSFPLLSIRYAKLSGNE